MEPHGRQFDAILASGDNIQKINISTDPWNLSSRLIVFLLFLILLGVIRINLVSFPPSENSQIADEVSMQQPTKIQTNAFLPEGYDEKTSLNSFGGNESNMILHDQSRKPEVYVVHISGCAMSSAMNFFTRKLLMQYGVELLDTFYPQEANLGGNWEFMKGGVNKYYHLVNDNITETFELLAKEVRESGKSAIIKLEQETPEVIQKLKSVVKPKWVFAHRGHVLDRLICEIRDCFLAKQKHIGYPVNAETGERDEQCFERRNNKGPKTKAYINSNGLMTTLKGRMDGQMNTRKKLQDAFNIDKYYLMPMITTEDLWAFEYEDVNDGYLKSMVAWSQLLVAWGFIPDEQKIANVMKAYGLGSRRQKPHRELIYNLDELIEQYKDHKLWKRFFRS